MEKRTDFVRRSEILEDFAARSARAKFGGLEETIWETAYDVVAYAQSVDAEPVRHGRWVKAHGMMPPEYFGRHECSLCKHFALSRKIGHEELSNYCPNCGARMHNEEDEEDE